MRFGLLFVLLTIIHIAIASAHSNDRRVSNRNNYTESKISTGKSHTLEIRNGTLWAWGYNWSGQLGDGTNTQRTTPIQIGTDDNWVCVKAGGHHSLGIKADGTLWAWGYNYSGQLGDSTTTDRNTPVQIGNDKDWAAISAGLIFSIAIKADGTLWVWGENNGGQYGTGSTNKFPYPVQVGNDSNWVSISARYRHCMGVKADGTLWTWGDNDYGRLGINNSNIANIYAPVQIGITRSWTKAVAGFYHSMAISANGTLWVWGRNDFGQVGDSTTINRNAPVQIGNDQNWVNVTTGLIHSFGIKANGTRWGWGRNNYGQLGNGSTGDTSIPARLDTLNNWVSITSYNYHSIAMKANGAVCTWGRNDYGQLGNGTTTGSTTTVPIDTADEWMWANTGHRSSSAVKNNGSAWEWGLVIGQTQPNSRNIHTMVDTSDSWTKVSEGLTHVLAMKADGTLWSWGFNGKGQLGNGTNVNRPTPLQVGTANDWVCIAAGNRFSLGLRADGRLWAWGYNFYGQLGNGSTTDTHTPVLVDTTSTWAHIAAGDEHCLAIKTDGTLWAWGRNSSGKLGDGSNVSIRTTPTQIGTARDWVGTAVGISHSIAIKADGSIWTWGDGSYGQLGDGTTTSRNTPAQAGAGMHWIKVDGGIADNHAISADGALWAWGLNWGGQRGDSTVGDVYLPKKVSDDNWVDIATGSDHTLGIKAPRTEVCGTGLNYDGQLGDGRNYSYRTDFACNCSLPDIYIMPVSKIVCDAGDTYFIIKARNITNYQWQVNTGNGWADISNNSTYYGATTDSLALVNINNTYNNYWYRCITYNGCYDSTFSDSAELKLGNTAIITTQPQNITICDSADAAFIVGAAGANITYQWQMNDGGGWNNINSGGIYSGANNDTLKLTVATTAVNGYSFRCRVSSLCTATSDTATIAVLPLTATSVSITLDDTLCAGDDASFTAMDVNGGTNPAYQWLVNGNSAGSNIANFLLNNPAPGDKVKCLMTSNVACPYPETSISNEISLQVRPYVTPTIAITSDVGTSWCADKENIFRSAITNGGATPSYQWKVNGTNIGPDTDTLFVPSLNNGDIVECLMTSGEWCTQPETAASNQITMKIDPSTNVNIVIMPNPDSVVCINKEVTMYCAFNTGGGMPYFQWMLNGVDMPGETSGTLKTTKLQDGDVINCRLSTDTGTCVFPDVSNPVGFEVQPILSPEVNISVLYLGNDQHLFTALPTDGGSSPVYQWYVNGKRQVNQNGSTITLTGLTQKDKVWVEMASSEQCIATNMRLVSSKNISTGVAEHITFKTLSLHPNPNNGTFIIEGNLGGTGAGQVNMTILNSLGQVVYSKLVSIQAGKLHHTTNLKQELAPGGYLLKLDYDGVQDFRRFVIAK